MCLLNTWTSWMHSCTSTHSPSLLYQFYTYSYHNENEPYTTSQALAWSNLTLCRYRSNLSQPGGTRWSDNYTGKWYFQPWGWIFYSPSISWRSLYPISPFTKDILSRWSPLEPVGEFWCKQEKESAVRVIICRNSCMPLNLAVKNQDNSIEYSFSGLTAGNNRVIHQSRSYNSSFNHHIPPAQFYITCFTLSHKNEKRVL